jgi:hypothetical protein
VGRKKKSLLTNEETSGCNHNIKVGSIQGDQIGAIFAQMVIVYFGQFLEITEIRTTFFHR